MSDISFLEHNYLRANAILILRLPICFTHFNIQDHVTCTFVYCVGLSYYMIISALVMAIKSRIVQVYNYELHTFYHFKPKNASIRLRVRFKLYVIHVCQIPMYTGDAI